MEILDVNDNVRLYSDDVDSEELTLRNVRPVKDYDLVLCSLHVNVTNVQDLDSFGASFQVRRTEVSLIHVNDAPIFDPTKTTFRGRERYDTRATQLLRSRRNADRRCDPHRQTTEPRTSSRQHVVRRYKVYVSARRLRQSNFFLPSLQLPGLDFCQ